MELQVESPVAEEVMSPKLSASPLLQNWPKT